MPTLAGRVKPKSLTVNEADWERAKLLMPMSVREMMLNQEQDQNTSVIGERSSVSREFEPDAKPESDIKILLPPGVGR